jgi:two-component SAPR family response regulator
VTGKKKNLPYLTVLEAPGGYGKTYHIEKTCSEYNHTPVLKFIRESAPGSFFEELALLTGGSISNINTWENIKGKSDKEIILVFDDFHLIPDDTQVISFLDYLIKVPVAGFHIFIANRYPVNLRVSALIASAKGIYLNKENLQFSLENFKKLWQENQLEMKENDLQFFNHCQGWPLGIMLYLRYRTGEISKDIFNSLLAASVNDTLPVFKDKTDISSQLKNWFSGKEAQVPLFSEQLIAKFKTNPQYWIQHASAGSLLPPEVRLYLDRGLSLAIAQENSKLLLNILTRFAHSHSLSGQFNKVDEILKAAESYFEEGKTVDQIAWMYMKANRLRQNCTHHQARIILKEIIKLDCSDPVSLNFQTRSRVVLGLIEYQQGNYEYTRIYYNDAFLLAKAEGNETLILEIKIMLAFLDVLEGKNYENLPEDIIATVEKQPLKSQPLMWLNLAFYWLLGERFDLKLGISILEKIKNVARQLGLDYLRPLIADIEARIFRFNHEYAKANECHQVALSLLENTTFEYLQALLNYALTLIKENRKEEAEEKLNLILENCAVTDTKGIAREAETLLREITPDFDSLLDKQEKILTDTANNNISLKMFGSFELKIGSKIIAKWGRKTSKQLFIYLILHRRGIHRETLADLMFPAETLDNPLKNLDVSIHSLRRALEPERKTRESTFILFQDSCYTFNWNYPHNIDLLDFENLFKEWKKSYTIDVPAAREIAIKALNIYKGELLPEPDFAELWLEEREDYRRKAISINNWLTEYYFNNNDFTEAEHWAVKLISLDNVDENGYLFLMKIAGQKKDKIHLKNIYEKLISTFKKELDDSPSDQILNTYKSIFALCK